MTKKKKKWTALTVMEKINMFEALSEKDQNISNFNRIFKKDLRASDSCKISIGEIIAGQRRVVSIGDDSYALCLDNIKNIRKTYTRKE